MKKDYLLIIAGIIPLLFSIFVFNFYAKDDRKDLFNSAKLLGSQSVSKIGKGDFVKFSGAILEKNVQVKDNYVLAVHEKYQKGSNGKRSEWIRDEFYFQTIFVGLENGLEIKVDVAGDYLPCGDGVKIVDLEPKKSRILGISSGQSVSAVGQIIGIDPIHIQTGHSLCTGTIENYQTYITQKWLGYIFILFCISLPSFGLIYLGLFKGKSN